MKRDKTLADLPEENENGLHRFLVDSSNYPREQYVESLRQDVHSPEELLKFVERWELLWRMKYSGMPEEMTSEECKIVERSFDAEKVLQSIQKNRQREASFDIEDENERISANIMAPPILVLASMVEEHFGAPFSIAFFRICEEFLTEEQVGLFY